jgi:hypothetical protein
MVIWSMHNTLNTFHSFLKGDMHAYYSFTFAYSFGFVNYYFNSLYFRILYDKHLLAPPERKTQNVFSIIVCSFVEHGWQPYAWADFNPMP